MGIKPAFEGVTIVVVRVHEQSVDEAAAVGMARLGRFPGNGGLSVLVVGVLQEHTFHEVLSLDEVTRKVLRRRLREPQREGDEKYGRSHGSGM
jgi:hypothetical protein